MVVASAFLQGIFILSSINVLLSAYIDINNQCELNNEYYDLGSVWYTDECTTFKCIRGDDGRPKTEVNMCSALNVDPGCEEIPGDKSQKNPLCCPSVRCMAFGVVDVEEEDQGPDVPPLSYGNAPKNRITSITTLMVLSFERYLMISKPLHTRHLSKKGAMVLVVAIWIYSLILTTPPLLGWGSYVHEAANISCSVNWESRTLGTTTYIVFLFAMGLVVPVFVISFSYLNIIRTMKQHSSLRVGRVTKAESKVAFMVGAMIVSFLVAWTPYAVLALLIAFGDPHIVTPGMAVVPALIAKSSICYNPLIYVGLNTQFRSSWKKLIGAKNSLEASQDPGGENTFLSPTRMVSQAPGEDQRLSVSKVMAKASEEKTAVEPRTVTHRPVITINKPKKTLYSVFQDQWSKKQPRVKLRTEGTTVSGVNSTKVDEVEEIELGDITTLKIVPNIKPV